MAKISTDAVVMCGMLLLGATQDPFPASHASNLLVLAQQGAIEFSPVVRFVK